MKGNGSIYYLTPTVGMRVWRHNRYGKRTGTVVRINRRSVTVNWDDSLGSSEQTRQLLGSYEQTAVFPVTEAQGGE